MCKKYVIPVVLMFVLCALPFSLFPAEDSETAPMFTEEVEVVGNVPVIKAIQSVSIYKAEDIEQYNFESLKSVLKLTPGLLTLSNGRFGQSSSTTIRGSRTTQVLYIVDGIKLRDKAGIGGVNLSVLSPNVIDKLEVVRGPLSNIYGSDAMGGVISMNTFSGDGANFMASFGSHGSYTGNFAGGTKFKDVTLGVSVNTQRYSDNIQNDVFKNTGLTTKLNYKTDTMDTGLRFFGSFTDSGIPINYGAPTPERNSKQDYYIVGLPFKYRFNENSAINAQLSYTKSKYVFTDPQDIYGAYYMSNFDNYEAEITYSGKFFEKLNLRTGIDYSNQTILNENDFGKSLDDEKMNYLSGFVSTALNLDALQLSASFRYDKYKDVDANFSPQLGISYLVANKLKLRAAYSKSFLAPLLSQQANPWGAANFGLDPETAESFEFGAEYYSQKVVLSAVYFNTQYKDMIEWVTTDWVTYVGQYQNLKEVDAYGVELAATFRPMDNLTVSGAYSYINTEDKATGEALVRRPKNIFSASAVYANKRFSAAVSMVYVGKRSDYDYTAYPPDVETPAFNTFDFSLAVPVYKGLTVFGKMTNLFDKEYQEIFSYPAPGRRFEVGLKYKVR